MSFWPGRIVHKLVGLDHTAKVSVILAPSSHALTIVMQDHRKQRIVPAISYTFISPDTLLFALSDAVFFTPSFRRGSTLNSPFVSSLYTPRKLCSACRSRPCSLRYDHDSHTITSEEVTSRRTSIDLSWNAAVVLISALPASTRDQRRPPREALEPWCMNDNFNVRIVPVYSTSRQARVRHHPHAVFVMQSTSMSEGRDHSSRVATLSPSCTILRPRVNQTQPPPRTVPRS